MDPSLIFLRINFSNNELTIFQRKLSYYCDRIHQVMSYSLEVTGKMVFSMCVIMRAILDQRTHFGPPWHFCLFRDIRKIPSQVIFRKVEGKFGFENNSTLSIYYFCKIIYTFFLFNYIFLGINKNLITVYILYNRKNLKNRRKFEIRPIHLQIPRESIRNWVHCISHTRKP